MRLILVLFVVATCSFYELLASPIYEDAEFLRQSKNLIKFWRDYQVQSF